MQNVLVRAQLLLQLHAVQREEVTSGEAGSVVCQGPVDKHVHGYPDEWGHVYSTHMLWVSVLLDTLGWGHCGLC